MIGSAKASPALSGVPETLLITLAARLLAYRLNPDLGFVDPAAETIGAALDFDPNRFAHDRASLRGALVRSRWFDRVTATFIHAHPDGLVVSIGSGLDTRPHRLGLPSGLDWIDIDFPEVIALREALVPALPRVRSWAGDGTDVAAWAEAIGWRTGRPVLMAAEGVSMYLEPEQGRRWLAASAEEAARRQSALRLVLDFASPMMARNGRRNPSVRKTKARFRWGVSGPAEIERLGYRLRETHDVARQSGSLSRLVGATYRLLTGRLIYSCAVFDASEARRGNIPSGRLLS